MSSRLSRSWSRTRAWISRLLERPTGAGDEIVRVRIHVEYDELDHAYIAKCIDLPGCVSYGATEHEAISNLIEAFTGVMNVRLHSRVREAMLAGEMCDNARYSRHLALTV